MWSFLVTLCVLVCVEGYLVTDWTKIAHEYTESKSSYESCLDEGCGEPVFLTPLLKKGEIKKAQKLSRVRLEFKNIVSYSGFFTVNATCLSNLFFWFFRAKKDWKNAPVILWLQGGPGASSLYGLFEENGPIFYNSTLNQREHSWNNKANLIYIDQPVGTGFSFTGNGCYAKTGNEAGQDLYSAVNQFFQLFPKLRKNKFFVAGESYGGHYVPTLGHAIHQNNNCSRVKINLGGLLIGNGIMDMMYQRDYSSYLYQLGLIDDYGKSIMIAQQEVLFELIEGKKWEQANYNFEAFNINANKKVNNFNYLKKGSNRMEVGPWVKYIQNIQTRQSIHVGYLPFNEFSKVVYDSLSEDIVQSVKPQVEELLEHYPMVFYHGQLDIICAYPMAENFFNNLEFSGAEEYRMVERKKWCVKDELAGFHKSSGNLHVLLVRNAGHMVPSDQPLWTSLLLDSIINSRSKDPLEGLEDCSGFKQS